MASPRKHPSLYPIHLTDLLLGPSIIIYLPNHRAAINFRYQLYAFREALRKHPLYAPVLLNRANSIRLTVEGTTLHLTKGDSQS